MHQQGKSEVFFTLYTEQCIRDFEVSAATYRQIFGEPLHEAQYKRF